MTRPTRNLVGLGAAAAAVVGGWAGYDRMYARPRAALEQQAAQVRDDIAAREEATDQLPILKKRLAAIAETTLGSEEETVSASLRTALNEIFAKYELREASVATRKPEPVKNPAAMKSSDFPDRAAKTRPDFYMVAASARAVGGLDDVVKMLATLGKQRWVHRIDRWTIAPVDSKRERFQVTVELTTAFLPDRAGKTLADSGSARVWEPIGDEQFALFRPILERTAFKAPPPEAAPAPVRASAPSAASPVPPYEEWRVTSLSRGRTGWEMWLKNSKSGQTLTLLAGDRVLDAKFVSATVELATVEIEGARFVVALGQTLGDRRPANQ